MTIRLTLLTPAAGPALRQARIDDDGPLDKCGLEHARAVARELPSTESHFTSPSRQCRETAAALGLDPLVETALRALDLGSWRGRTLDGVADADPDALAVWTTDPDAVPHGGESVRQLCLRVGGWLDRLPESAGRTLTVADPSVVRAAVVHALAAPPHAFWRVDLVPLARVHLTGRGGRWNLRL